MSEGPDRPWEPTDFHFSMPPVFPKGLTAPIDFSKIIPPIDLSGLVPSVPKLMAGVLASSSYTAHINGLLDGFLETQRAVIAPALQSAIGAAALLETQRRVIEAAFPIEQLARLAELANQLLPANLRGVHLPWDDLGVLLLDEGLPLAWVPRRQLVERMLAAPTPGARRAVYGRAWQQVVQDCEAVFDECRSAELVHLVAYGKKAAAGIRDGHHELAQAMSANLLESTLQLVVEDKTRSRLQRRDPDPDDRPKDYFLHCSIRACFVNYRPGTGAAIPTRFGRHPSAHAVSPRQYTRINSVLAIAHVAGVLRTLDDHLARGVAAAA